MTVIGLARPGRRVPVLYLDLDGTVREGKDDALGRFVNTAADVRVFPEAVVLMREWKARGGRIIAVTNQGGVALGIVPWREVVAAVMETQHQCEQMFDRMVICAHHPNAEDPEMARCWCRKPRIGGIIEAVIELGQEHNELYPPHLALFVGDRDEDRGAADALNVQFQPAAEWRATSMGASE